MRLFPASEDQADAPEREKIHRNRKDTENIRSGLFSVSLFEVNVNGSSPAYGELMRLPRIKGQAGGPSPKLPASIREAAAQLNLASRLRRRAWYR